VARVCVVWQHRILPETRVGREITALAEAGHEVDVICGRDGDQPRFERLGAVTFRRLSLRRRRGSFARDLIEHLGFFAVVTLLLGIRQLRRRYAVVQVNSVPETLVFAAIVPRLLGARIVLDMLEPTPEFFESRFGIGSRHPVVRVLAALEQGSIRFADAVITCTTLMRDAFTARGAKPGKVQVIHDGPDERVFKPGGHASGNGAAGPFTLICHGTVEERYGLDTVIRAIALVKPQVPGIRFRIVGEGSYLPALEELARELDVEESIEFTRAFVPAADLVEAIATADLGVVAMKRDAFRDLTLCAKLFDFVVMQKPTISSRTRSVERYFDESALGFFAAGDPVDLARAIRELHADPDRRRSLADNAALTAEPYRWPHERERYLGIIEGQIERARPGLRSS
jgi:glycosyltransferase involved in cell wall biosynthesis